MSNQKTCPRCSCPMVRMARSHDAAHVQELAFCQRCRLEEVGDIVPGCLEVEHEWYFHVTRPRAPSITALRALRRVPEFADVPLTALVKRLGEADLVVGPFRRADAVELLAGLRAAGLGVEMVADRE